MEDLTIEFTYKTLNFWRKLYLILILSFPILMIAGLVASIANGTAGGLGVGPMVFIAVPCSINIWTYFAVKGRKLTQLKIIAFINIIPMMNLIGLLIMLSIIRVTKNELIPNKDLTALDEAA